MNYPLYLSYSFVDIHAVGFLCLYQPFHPSLFHYLCFCCSPTLMLCSISRLSWQLVQNTVFFLVSVKSEAVQICNLMLLLVLMESSHTSSLYMQMYSCCIQSLPPGKIWAKKEMNVSISYLPLNVLAVLL